MKELCLHITTYKISRVRIKFVKIHKLCNNIKFSLATGQNKYVRTPLKTTVCSCVKVALNIAFFCNFTGTNEEVYNDYFQKEESTNSDAVKRNEIREKLLSMFQSIQVRLFRLPLNTVQNNPELEGLKNEILNKVIEPRRIGESAHLTPGNVSGLTRAIVEQLNEEKKLIVLSVVGLIQRQEIYKAHEQCRNSLSEIFEEKVQTCSPWSGIEEKLTNRKNGFIREFEEKTNKADFEPQCRNEYKEKLEKIFRNRLVRKKESIKQNQQAKIKNEAKVFKTDLVKGFDRIVLPQEDDRRIEQPMRNVATRLFEKFNHATSDLDLVTDRQQQCNELNQYCEQMIESRKQENRRQIECVEEAKEAYTNNLQDKFQSIPFPNPGYNLNKELQNAKRNVLRTFEHDTNEVNRFSEYKCQVKKQLELFSAELQREKLDEHKQRLGQRQLVDNEKAKYEKSLNSSFRKTILPVSQAGHLTEILEGEEDYCSRIFDTATREVDLESNYKDSVKDVLQLFTVKKTNEMITKNLEMIQGAYLFISIYTIVNISF